MDINTKLLKKNAFRVTKERGITAARVRVPGGHIEAKYLALLGEIAEKYGNGNLHITTRQGFEIPGISMKDINHVNKELQPIIKGLEINQKDPNTGYSASGTRNVSACIGNAVCPFANYNTTNFAKKIEKAIFPNDYHVKIALTGCPNDCIKSRMHDFGIIGMTEPQYDAYRCIGCKACVTNCKKRVTTALTFENFKVVRDYSKCIGCGECVGKCPTAAWSRSTKKYYKLVIMGRTGKKNPRIARDFITWIDEESIIKIILNTYDYIEEYIDKDAPGGKEHIGYIVDRTGYQEFKKWVLKDVNLGEEAVVADNINWY
ncbi:anaerobic sulfite reductase subunit C [Clostridium tetanomorphum]|uniref:Sulfite reductase subunit C n=1 Tax=Clostridium tetanomorphum TaxID=1553 RepID=A0A923J1Q6_CLOTT|nr:sulfite reductase subunit C [Clostridium tetanomorphum]KAJ49576.1 anaerobic sulfite reductase subunit C [Clostridium tetanomorphum DSM 665]KAJ51745.1 anaerobic sulfite reductase subunit C [Clostridium tetanomorphum DSM 665]MBC2397628.1 sulfite reductase subunit C [Clostridium tetanomorphum]MBP1864980.1 anaerobic sulfite reductase subunit C [Clostridium tetanomorphum]NRS83423.1 anaerobic sulfite reductase subunit C [Clostridium tetanomorphum]